MENNKEKWEESAAKDFAFLNIYIKCQGLVSFSQHTYEMTDENFFMEIQTISCLGYFCKWKKEGEKGWYKSNINFLKQCHH